ncbi:MAG: superoxide dismutase [Bacilli bacterium]
MQELKYAYNTLNPYISTRTLMVHYNKHYLNYINIVSKLIKENNLINVLNNIQNYDLNKRDIIIYNIGGVLNHELYFNSMNPNNNHTPIGDIKTAINDEFENYDNFIIKFKEMANNLVGSGYTFLVINKNKQLQIVNMPNQETPYLYNLIPILALDLWEHAYYLDYQSERSKYIDAFFQIIDFDNINKLYEENIKK